MKNIVLIGDSTMHQYADRVQELLGDGYKVYYSTDNGKYTKYTLWNIRFWMQSFDIEQVDLIHWDIGCWEHHRTTDDPSEPLSTIEEYLYDSRRLYRQLLRYTKNLIWSSTTCVNSYYNPEPEGLDPLSREDWNHEIRLYNAVVGAYLKEEGVRINDLCSLIAADEENIRKKDGIHLSDKGIEVAAKAIADAIKDALK